MTKIVKRSYDVLEKNTNKVLWENLPTREVAREEKQFWKHNQNIEAYIVQNVYVLKEQTVIR